MRSEKCYTCKWRRYTGGSGMSSRACLISESGRTALFRYKSKTYDRRGPDKNDCLLYEKADGRIRMMDTPISYEEWEQSVFLALKLYNAAKITECIECGRLIKYQTNRPLRCNICKRETNETNQIDRF